MTAERGVARQVSELKASAHTMALEPGLYCVFNASNSPAPSDDTGLPGVRISEAPGQQAGGVVIAGFQSNGWIGPDAAALIRVTGQTGKVLVTVYQEASSTSEAPKLQVVRLSPDPTPPAQPLPAQPAHPAVRRGVEVVAHVYGQGDIGGRLNEWIGEPGSKRWIEGFAVAPVGVPAQDIEYQAVLGRGWLSPWAEGGQFCGSRGMSLPILGMRVKLRGDSAATHRVQLLASFVDGTQVGPLHDGDACEAPSLAALEAFQLAVLPAAQAVVATSKASRNTAPVKAAPKAARSPAIKSIPSPVPAKAASPSRAGQVARAPAKRRR